MSANLKARLLRVRTSGSNQTRSSDLNANSPALQATLLLKRTAYGKCFKPLDFADLETFCALDR